MHPFQVYWKGLTKDEKLSLASSVDSSYDYLRQIGSTKKVSVKLSKALAKESGRSKEYLFPEIWKDD